METRVITQPATLYNLKIHMAPHLDQFMNDLEKFKLEVFITISERYELTLPSQKGYMKIKPYQIKSGEGKDEKVINGYDFWILINALTYALQFIINDEGNITIVLHADGRVKPYEGPLWCWDRFSKVEETKKHEFFVEKIDTWLTAEEVYDLLGMIVEYVDVERIRE